MATTLTTRQNQNIDEILRMLDSTNSQPEISKRHRNRVSLRLNLNATLLNNPTFPKQTIYTRNMSVAGLGFLCRREFSPQDWLVIHLQVPNRPIRLLLGQVVFCRYLRSGLFDVGLEFKETGKEGCEKFPLAWAKRAVEPTESAPVGAS